MTSHYDEIAKYNQGRWGDLVRAGIEFSKPRRDATAESARATLNEWSDIDKFGLGDVAGKEVLCLASGGGQQSVFFSLLGARVTVFDLTPEMLDGDRAMAAHYGFDMRIEQGDMRDLSRFADGSFDLIYQPYSINFIPDPAPVFAEVSRVLRSGGHYYLQYGNPLWSMEETDWTGEGYPILMPYEQGTPTSPEDLPWDVWQDDGSIEKVQGPKEFRHTMSTLINGICGSGMVIIGTWEGPPGDASAEPGSWEHLKTYLPLWPAFWSRRL